MATGILREDLHVAGNLSASSLTIPAGTLTDAGVEAGAGIQATKLEHQHTQVFKQNHGTAATSQRQVIHTVYGAEGSIVSFRAGVVVANIGAATISIQLKKNGSNILSSALVLDSTNAAFSMEDAAGFTSTALVADDVLEVDATATAGGGTLGQGLFCELVVREDATP